MKVCATFNRETGTNYEIAWKMINTADYGVPQIRERIFVVGSRNGRRFRFPEKTLAGSHFREIGGEGGIPIIPVINRRRELLPPIAPSPERP
jgi:site-specific DNA-cytosine methylase